MICDLRPRLKANVVARFCFSVFFCVFFQSGFSEGETSSEPSIRAEIGMRLPDASSLDPRVFPFETRPQMGLCLNGDRESVLRSKPVSLQRKFSLDQSGDRVNISEEMFGQTFASPYAVPLKTYFEERLGYERKMLWHENAARSVYTDLQGAQRGAGGISIDIPVPIKSKAFSQLFGGSSVGLNVAGDIRIEGGFRREDRSETRTAFNRGANTNFKMNQTQRFTVTGRIGEKVSVNVDQDSERAFEFENNIKLNYTGFDDEVVKKIEAGNVALSLPGTNYVTFGGTSAGLFGIKSEMQFGNMNVTTIASQEKGENKTLTATGGATEGGDEIRIRDYKRNTYFFLSHSHRNNYRRYYERWLHTYNNDPALAEVFGCPVKRIEVYKSAPKSNPSSVPGIAENDLVANERFEDNFVRLSLETDYILERQLGYIRLNTQLGESELLAVAFEDSCDRTYGDVVYAQGDTIRLKLLRGRGISATRNLNSVWHLEWKNVYSLGSRNIPDEGFDLKIYYQPASGDLQENLPNTTGGEPVSYLQIFGLDVRDVNGAKKSDNVIDIDRAFLNLGLGELIFPDLRPFDPAGVEIRGGEQTDFNTTSLPQDLRADAIYDTSNSSRQDLESLFVIKYKSKNPSTSYNLGFNVIEGSEKVTLGGSELVRDQDYVIDYFSGQLNIINEAASKPDAVVNITYQSNQLFQLEKKTILGTRAEYRLNQDSFIGGTLLYLNERTLDQRVRLGGSDKGPMRNMVWDLNTKLQFRPNFLSRALDAMPFISTQEGSDLRLEGEIAQILPNPNTLNSETTGDMNGVAYVDDFESAKRTTPFGVNRRGWIAASIPIEVLSDNANINEQRGDPLTWPKRRSLARRGRLTWGNPYGGIAIKTIWPERDVNANVAQTVQVLQIDFNPDAADSLQIPRTKAWAGIMRALSAGYHDQNDAKFLEVIVRGSRGRLHLDLGQISEDALPDGKLNSEDEINPVRLPNNLLEDDEDLGLDGVDAPDPQDWWDVNRSGNQPGVHKPDWGEPASLDDWYYNSGTSNFDYGEQGTANGTEGNRNDEGGPRPDTEDINGNGVLDQADNYFSYFIDLDTTVANPYRSATNPKTGWYLYRVPLSDIASTVRSANFSDIEFVRLWIDGMEEATRIYIAEINIVSNEWKEYGVSNQDLVLSEFQKNDDKFAVTVVNTEDNPKNSELPYDSPPGVQRERDRINQVLAKEQSQVLRVNGLLPGETGLALKSYAQGQELNFVRYKRLKMFLYGRDAGNYTGRDGNKGTIGQLISPDTSFVEFFLRFGADEGNFYEFRERVYPGWDDRNLMDIDLAELTNFKRLRTDFEPVGNDTAATTSYFRKQLNSHQELRVRGNPTITRIKVLVAGVRNVHPNLDFTGDIWMDDLRVSEVEKEKGMAMRLKADLKLADFMTLGADIERTDADFHNVATRFGTGDNTQRLNLRSSITADKVLPQALGLSVPVTMSYSESKATPKYFPQSDIVVPDTLVQFKRRGDNRAQVSLEQIQNFTNQMGFNISVRRRLKSRNFLIKTTLDNLGASFSYAYGRSINSTTIRGDRKTYTGNLDYDLSFGRDNFFKPFAWIGKAPIFGRLTDTKLYYTPQKIVARIDANNNDQITQTRTIQDGLELPGREVRSNNFGVNYNYGTSIKVFESLTADFARTYNTRVRPKGGSGVDSIGAMTFVQGLRRFVYGQSDVLSNNQTFTTRYNPNLFSWLTNSLSYSSNYRYTNSIQAAQTGRSANVGTNISANTTLRISQIFQSLTRKKGPAQQPPKGRQPPRGKPGEKPGEKEGESPESPEEGQRKPPGQQGEEPKEKGKEKSSEKAGESAGGINLNPLVALGSVLGKLKDLSLTYSDQENLGHSALLEGTPNLRYQFGFADNPGIGTIANITTNPRSFSRNVNYGAQTGFDLTRSINVTARFNYTTQETETTTRTGSSSLSYFQLGKEGEGIPFPEWTLSWGGLEKIAFLKNLTSTVSARTNFSGKKSNAWRDSTSGVTNEDFSISFQPLVELNVSWKNGMVSKFAYNRTNGYKPVYTLYNVEPGDNGEIDRFQSATFNRSTDISLSHTYSKRSGFRIPLPFLKNKELKNSIDLSITYTRRVTDSSQKQRGRDVQENDSTVQWTFKPQMSYSFSTRVRGGAHFDIGEIKSKRSGNTKIKELGIDVNISIRGN